ncbi:MAG TPA: M36 family metallopeptidase [Candidatus Saccharimonadia bacterium]|nr:M36 family metallopeptidase [Candidatus Saccharimonadia bacterium]
MKTSCDAFGAAVRYRAPACRTPRLSVAAFAASIVLMSSAAHAGNPAKLGADHRVQLLTQPRAADAEVIAQEYFASQLATLGLTAADVAVLALERRYATQGLGTNLFYQQRINGIPVWNALTSVHVLDSGAILTVNNTAVPNVAQKLSATAPVVSALDAVRVGLLKVGIDAPQSALVQLQVLEVARQGVAFAGTGATKRPIPVRLIYTPRRDGAVRLAWEMYVMASSNEVWYMHVDALDGTVLEQHNLVHSLHKYRVYGFNSESPISTEVPTDLHHDLTPETGDKVASPDGWHTGLLTTGNNVEAVEDRDNSDSGGFQPAGTAVGSDLVFDFAHNDAKVPCEQPSAVSTIASDPEFIESCAPFPGIAAPKNTNLQAAIVNLFYWNNIVHDVMFHYGFTEGAGNFQQTNHSLEGAGRDFDAVFAQAQDGSGTNNANFFTPPDDGVTPILLPPAMQMYEWSPPGIVRVNLPLVFDDFDDDDKLLAAATSSFGQSLKVLSEAARTGQVALGNDGSTAGGTGTVNDGCEALVGFPAGKIALLDRGLCEFGVKVLNAEKAGAKGAIIANTLGREFGTPMGPGVVGGQVTIPSVMIGMTNGARLKAALTDIVDVTLDIAPVPNRDSDIDNGIIAHEYGHGISNRLIGGPTSIACLINGQQPDPNNPGATIPIGEQMGEGWSDLYGLILTAQAADTGNTPRGIGAYISYQNQFGPGIRRFPYSRDMNVNPLTYGNVPAEAVPHGVGTVWATMVWDMYWNLVDTYGYEPDLFKFNSPKGNVRTLHLINNGIIVTKCRPSFVDARNGILTAEAADGNTTDSCAIWNAFARRGLGVAAINPTGGEDHREAVEDFTVPAFCSTTGQPPVAQNDAYSTAENTLLSVQAPGVLANDSDADADPITASVTKEPDNDASFTLNPDGSFSYQPSASFEGTDTFRYVAQSNGVSSAEATVTITVTPGSDTPPTAVADTATMVEDSTATIDVLANDTNADGGPKEVASATQPTNGTVIVNPARTDLSFTPDANFCSTTPQTFTYALNGGSSTTVSVTVTCVDDRPNAFADAATVAQDSAATAINVLANDTDVDGGAKTIVSVTQPANGTVVITGSGTGLTYRPNTGYCATTADTFTYTLNGGTSATVSVTVTCTPPPPLVDPLFANGFE